MRNRDYIQLIETAIFACIVIMCVLVVFVMSTQWYDIMDILYWLIAIDAVTIGVLVYLHHRINQGWKK
jgi:hypothetical protein